VAGLCQSSVLWLHQLMDCQVFPRQTLKDLSPPLSSPDSQQPPLALMRPHTLTGRCFGWLLKIGFLAMKVFALTHPEQQAGLISGPKNKTKNWEMFLTLKNVKYLLWLKSS
jgi:hypothetical protein